MNNNYFVKNQKVLVDISSLDNCWFRERWLKVPEEYRETRIAEPFVTMPLVSFIIYGKHGDVLEVNKFQVMRNSIGDFKHKYNIGDKAKLVNYFKRTANLTFFGELFKASQIVEVVAYTSKSSKYDYILSTTLIQDGKESVKTFYAYEEELEKISEGEKKVEKNSKTSDLPDIISFNEAKGRTTIVFKGSGKRTSSCEVHAGDTFDPLTGFAIAFYKDLKSELTSGLRSKLIDEYGAGVISVVKDYLITKCGFSLSQIIKLSKAIAKKESTVIVIKNETKQEVVLTFK